MISLITLQWYAQQNVPPPWPGCLCIADTVCSTGPATDEPKHYLRCNRQTPVLPDLWYTRFAHLVYAVPVSPGHGIRVARLRIPRCHSVCPTCLSVITTAGGGRWTFLGNSEAVIRCRRPSVRATLFEGRVHHNAGHKRGGCFLCSCNIALEYLKPTIVR